METTPRAAAVRIVKLMGDGVFRARSRSSRAIFRRREHGDSLPQCADGFWQRAIERRDDQTRWHYQDWQRPCPTRAGRRRLGLPEWKARIGRHKVDRIEALPKVVRDIGWKAQVRLCTRYRRLSARGKTANVVNVAIAREMVGFIWSIACTVQSAPKTA